MDGVAIENIVFEMDDILSIAGQIHKLIVAWWHHMAEGIQVNIGSGNGLLPDGTKLLPEPMLTYHQ